jgi:DNA adenine methylase
MYCSPLRYPGGKRRLTHTVTQLLDANGLKDIHYAEPFAGGASIALALLYGEYASTIHLNDLCRPVYAFWHTVLHENDWLCRRLDRVRVTMRVWDKQRSIYDRQNRAELAELGFAGLFLNRCNRSGIIGGGVIGGREQAGEWNLTARFGKPELIARIRKIGRYANRIRLYQMDGLEFTDKVFPSLGKRGFAFIDPPYIDSGHGLYFNEYGISNHRKLAQRVVRLTQPWAVTYDRAAISSGLYKGRRRVVYDLRYVAQDRYAGREVMFVSDKLALPSLRELMGARMLPVASQCRLKAV